MAVFLMLEGLAGESADDHHAGEIDVAAWSLGVTNPASTHAGGGGGGAGRATFMDLQVTKRLDRASPLLMLAAAAGRHLRSGTLTVTSGGHRPVEYLRVGLEDVQVTSCLLADTSDPDRPMENVSLAYGRIHVAYTQQSPTGGVGAVTEFAWDLIRNGPN
jgi:type VI secretion system secreted protein Hcp